MSAVETACNTSAEESARDLYERHADRVFGFCRNRLRSQEEAEDATQTTFLYAFRALQRGTFPVSEKAWLFKIAENVCLAAHRSNGRRSDRELANGADIVELAPAREDRREALFGLDEALAVIPDRQRRAFVLRELRGLSNREIAGEIGVTVTAVEMLVFRARRNLARALDSGAALKGRVAGLVDLGAILNLLKTGVGGATAAKVVAAAAVVTIAALPAGDAPAPQKGPALTVHAEKTAAQVGVFDVAETTDGPGAKPAPAGPGPAVLRDRQTPESVDERTSRPGPGRLVGDEPEVPEAHPAQPPTVVSPLPPTPGVPPVPVAPPPPVIPVQLPESPVSIPTLPTLPPPPVELPDLDELLPPPPGLP